MKEDLVPTARPMRSVLLWVGGFFSALLVVLSGPIYADMITTAVNESGMRTRAPYMKTGAPTKLACTTGADADSGALVQNTTYIMRCESDAWVDWGTAATTALADDFKLLAGKYFRFSTSAINATHVSCLSVAVNGACYLHEAE